MMTTAISTVPSDEQLINVRVRDMDAECIAEEICDAYNWENFDDVAQLCSVYPMTRLLSISVASAGCLPDVQPILFPTYDIDTIYDAICSELDAQGASQEQLESVTIEDCKHDGCIPLHGLYSLSWQYIRASELI